MKNIFKHFLIKLLIQFQYKTLKKDEARRLKLEKQERERLEKIKIEKEKQKEQELKIKIKRTSFKRRN